MSSRTGIGQLSVLRTKQYRTTEDTDSFPAAGQSTKPRRQASLPADGPGLFVSYV